MAIREIRLSGDEILRKTSREVEEVTDKIRELLDDMVETMNKYNRVGLAAPQVGNLKRVILNDLSPVCLISIYSSSPVAAIQVRLPLFSVPGIG